MPDKPQNDYRATKLDPDLLSTPFTVQTNWHVITGAPCCGKTTLIDQLAGQGFRTVPEVARQYFEKELARGRAIGEIRKDRAAMTRRLTEMTLRIEAGLRADEFLFLDRGLPDALAFFRVAGLNPNAILSACFHHRYASVFVLDRLPAEKDGVRLDGDATRDLLGAWHARDYGALGYDVVRVPVLTPEERLAFVLEKLSEQGLL
jgi:predicted ATPase